MQEWEKWDGDWRLYEGVVSGRGLGGVWESGFDESYGVRGECEGQEGGDFW